MKPLTIPHIQSLKSSYAGCDSDGVLLQVSSTPRLITPRLGPPSEPQLATRAHSVHDKALIRFLPQDYVEKIVADTAVLGLLSQVFSKTPNH